MDSSVVVHMLDEWDEKNTVLKDDVTKYCFVYSSSVPLTLAWDIFHSTKDKEPSQ